ncbi:MAG TPA: DUF5995 family protein [Archangium sp.]|uniref:DUF5995 family protein n=1 Tax=Archangium sp. TaxID=1872627 RepID=UPI002E2EEA1D|nr:DUF5995 family protein [Archangium sp.]HEX5752692.1 DUF5995 family protein [Archangium sp.]
MADTFTASTLACGSDCKDGQHKPRNTGEALLCMKKELEQLYARNDGRAIFLRAYFVMTTQVNAAVHGTGDFEQTGPIFFDPAWVDRLAGRFAALYFESLTRSRACSPDNKPICAAWGMAMEQAARRRPSILLCMLLGINAHINFDLAQGIHEIVREDLRRLRQELKDPETRDRRVAEQMARWKFDHDQMNNVLVRTNPKIQEILGREFRGAMRLLSRMGGQLDELLTSAGLRYYRDRVWNNVLGLLAAGPEEFEKVKLRLGWESQQMAEFLLEGGWLNNAVFRLDRGLRRGRFEGRFQPGLDGVEVHAAGRLDHRLQRPF